MPGQNKISPKINNHFRGCVRMIREHMEDMGNHDITVKDVVDWIEEKYFTDYRITVVVEENVQDYEDQGNQAVLEVLDKVRIDMAKLELYIPEISEYKDED